MPVTSRDVNDVARIVSKKLEQYINRERREMNFDPSGGLSQRPIIPTWEFDRVNSMVTRDKSERRRSFREKQLRQKRYRSSSASSRRRDNIDPLIIDDDFRCVSETEVESLVRIANQVFEKQPISELQQVLAYRPRPENFAGQETPQNFTYHVGSCLLSQSYKEFYEKYGLKSGDVRNRLTPRVEHSSDQSAKTPAGSQNKICHNGRDSGHTGNAKETVDRSKGTQKPSSSQTRYKASVRSLITLLLDDEASQALDSEKNLDGVNSTALDNQAEKDSKVNTAVENNKTPLDNSPTYVEPSESNKKEIKIDEAYFQALYQV